ncbi:DUF3786 domain-containing protein [Desulfobacca acetoxidans]
MPISALQLFKHLPQTNCGDCGYPTCLAFATQVVVEGADPTNCPHLSDEAKQLSGTIREQQQQGVGRRRDKLAIALKFLQEKVAPLDFATLATGLGAICGEEEQRPYLELTYFGQTVRIFKDEVRYPAGTAENPWDAILLYNYIASQAKRPPCGQWVKFEGLPHSVSKSKTLHRLQRQLAAALSGKKELLAQRALTLGAQPASVSEDADLQFIFRPLPHLPLLLIFHDAEAEENFAAEAHFLFDAQVMNYLDLESLLFLVERLMDYLLEKY